MDHYYRKGYNSLFGLLRKEYNLYRLNDENDYTLLESIYESLGFREVFGLTEEDDLVETILSYFVSNGVPVNKVEERVIEGIEDKLEGTLVREMGDKIIKLPDGKEVNLKKGILGKTNIQVRELMEIIEFDLTCFKIFDQFRRGIIKFKDMDKKLDKFLKDNVDIFREDTNIAIKEMKGQKIEFYLPVNERFVGEDGEEIEPKEYLKRLIYREIQDPTTGYITYSLKNHIVNFLNTEGSLYLLNEKNPALLFHLEFSRRRNGLDSVKEVIEDVCSLGLLIDKEHKVMCYHGNIDKTLTLHVKNTEARIDNSYLGVINNDKSIKFFASGGNVYVTSDKFESRVSLWEYLLGQGAKPADNNYNNILKENIL
mgnify:CR=1 FL=1